MTLWNLPKQELKIENQMHKIGCDLKYNTLLSRCLRSKRQLDNLDGENIGYPIVVIDFLQNIFFLTIHFEPSCVIDTVRLKACALHESVIII